MNIIYALIDPVDGLTKYIGYTSDPDNRLRRHMQNRGGTKEKRIWISHLKKMNLQPIMQTIQEYKTPEELLAAEIYWYNFHIYIGTELFNDPTFIGNSCGKGSKRSLESRLKMSIAMKGRVSCRKGVKLSDSTKLKLSKLQLGNKSCLGRKLSEETKLKISLALKKYNDSRSQ